MIEKYYNFCECIFNHATREFIIELKITSKVFVVIKVILTRPLK